MSEVESFNERVKRIAIECAAKYKEYYVDYEYMIFSEAFSSDYYIISAEEDNYMHLLGVNSRLGPQNFFDKSINGMLDASDFDYNKRGESPNAAKGSVRRKINVITGIFGIFDSGVDVQEDFKKNRIICSFAASNGICTIGFTLGNEVRPKTLLKGNELDKTTCRKIDVVLRRKSGEELFDTLTYGTIESCLKYRDIISQNCTESLNQKIFAETLL